MFRLPVTVHRIALAGTSAAAFVLAGCSESTSAPSRELASSAASLSQSPELNDPSGRHLFHTKPWFENDNAQNAQNNSHGKPGGGGGGTNTGIYYHGGPVLQLATNVVAIYWGTSQIYGGGPTPGTTGAGAQDGSLIGDFLSNLGTSSYFAINSSYTDGSGANIVAQVNYNRFWANPTSPNASNVSDADMVAMLQSGFNSGSLAYDASTLYAIFTGRGVNLGGGFSSSNLQYCAYHYHGTVTINGVARTVLYAAMPYDYTFPGYCTNNTSPPNSDWAADAEVNTLAHEIEETTTDMLGTAWFDNRGYENADKCAWNFGQTTTTYGGVSNILVGAKHYLVQQNWVNAGSGGCAQSY